MPRTPETQSQKSAPGPPRNRAVATPAMLPTPTVDARAVATAWNGVTLPSPPPCLVSFPRTSRSAVHRCRNCTARVRTVRTNPVPITTRSRGAPQTRLFSHVLARVMRSIMISAHWVGRDLGAGCAAPNLAPTSRLRRIGVWCVAGVAIPGTAPHPEAGKLSRHRLRETPMTAVRFHLLLALTALAAAYPATASAMQVKTVASGLDTPWDLAWGPDGAMWVTERSGRISRVDLTAGTVTLVGELKVTEVSESGLMGMAFHPDFSSQPYVYLAHSYRSVFGIGNRLLRMRYANGARLAIGPDRMLYLTTGDAGDAGRSQDRKSLAGKVLRLTLEGKPAPGNPFGNAIWSYGHRNPQGIAFQPGTNRLYVAEHGPSEADEVNLIEHGRNYGWPQ